VRRRHAEHGGASETNTAHGLACLRDDARPCALVLARALTGSSAAASGRIPVNVQDVMTRSVQCCGPNDSLSHAAHLLWENDCGCLPVKDEGGRVVAMLTDRDICMAAYTQGRTLDDLRVNSAMSHDVHKVGPDDTLPRAHRLMQEQQVRRLPVVDMDGMLVGVISLNDLACEAARDSSRRSRGVGSSDLEGVAVTLAAICRPRNERPEQRAAETPAAKPSALERPFAGAT